MKKIILPLFIAGLSITSFAQENSQEPAPKDWFHKSIDSGTYGVNTEKAYEFLKETGRKPQTIIVGILDSGVDADHEDLKDVMWVNKNEIAGNGIDDDKNGHIDDIHGWNFLGNEKGENVTVDNLEITRLYASYRSKFENNKERKIKKNKKKFPAEYKIYLDGKEQIEKNRDENTFKIAQLKAQKEQYTVYASQFNSTFKNTKEYLKTESVSADQLKSAIKDNNIQDKRIKAILVLLFEEAEKQPNKTVNINDAQSNFQDLLNTDLEGITEYINYLESKIKFHYNPDLNSREIVGDNYNNKKESNYGNNDVEGPDAMHGTHVAGLVAASRNNGIGMNGVANNVEIMSVRVVPDGDERDKDVANGIRYAVDNGAKILNMSFGKSYSPDKTIVDDALKYAEKKGALLIHAAGNSSYNLDITPNFPINTTKNDTIAKNWLTIGASTPNKEHLAANFSNYGSNSVDLFSPGTEIYSTVPNNKYKNLQGTSMSTPIASGVAALVWSYYPQLNANELRSILLESVNLYKGNVDTPADEEQKPKQAFNKLSTSGGVIDAYNAVRLAEDYVNKNK